MGGGRRQRARGALLQNPRRRQPGSVLRDIRRGRRHVRQRRRVRYCQPEAAKWVQKLETVPANGTLLQEQHGQTRHVHDGRRRDQVQRKRKKIKVEMDRKAQSAQANHKICPNVANPSVPPRMEKVHQAVEKGPTAPATPYTAQAKRVGKDVFGKRA